MKITDVKTWCVQPEGFRRDFVFVKIETDEGLYGIGEAYSCGPDLATVEAIRYFRDWLIGEDPSRIEYLWTKLYNYSRFPGGCIVDSAISGIDLALWDLAGKAADLPVYKLIGGASRDRIWCYTGSARGKTDEECVSMTQELIDRYGYTALKIFQPFSGDMPVGRTRKALESKFEAFRKAFGEDFELAIDFHARNYEPYRAVWFAEAIRPYRPLFIEEPIRMENVGQMAKLKPQLGAPLATGECLYTKYEFRNVLDAEAADILQPDLLLCGGLTEARKIAAMAEAEYKVIAPHNPLSPLSTVINAHFAAAVPNFMILETHDHNMGGHEGCSRLVTKVLSPKDGAISVSELQGAGWGVDLDYEYLDSLEYVPWHRHFAVRADGGIDVV